MENNQTLGFFLELNGWSNETYVYHELLVKNIAPKPGSENRAIQGIRLNLAIRDYVNGGKNPVLNDFSLLATVSNVPFDKYVKEVTKTKRQGSMSLAGVVERLFNMPAPLENPMSQEYDKYLKLRDALGNRTAAYINWKKYNVDLQPSMPPGGYYGDPYGPGGSYPPGGGNYTPPPIPSGNPNWDGAW